MAQFIRTLVSERRVGRLRRWPYFLAINLTLIVWLILFGGIYLALGGDLDQVAEHGFSLPYTIAGLLIVEPLALLLVAGRLNDIGLNGWWSLLVLGNLTVIFTNGECSWICGFYTLFGLFLYLMPGKKIAGSTASADSLRRAAIPTQQDLQLQQPEHKERS